MSEAAAVPAAVTETPSREASIQDAIDSLFTAKESEPRPVETPGLAEPVVAEDAAAEAVLSETETTAELETPVVTPAPAKVSASDHALAVAKAKKLAAKASAAIPAQATPNADAIRRAAAIEAAGGDPLKQFKALGLDLATIVRAHENEIAANPQYSDPLEREVKTLAGKLAQLENEKRASEDAKATDSFFTTARQMIAKSGDAFEYVAAYGAEGEELVKQLVLSAAEGDEENNIPPHILPLVDALKLAEEHYSAKAEIAAKTKKLAKKFQAQTRKPALPQQSPTAGGAPATQTQAQSVTDVINDSIDALLG